MAIEQKYLIIDDDYDDVDFFCEAVEQIKSNVLCCIARNGEEALKLLRQGMTDLPDFIFLDLNMPIMDGLACLSALKQDKGLRDIPVIIYTTSSHSRDREATKALGASYYLVKPTSFKKICENILIAIEEVTAQKS